FWTDPPRATQSSARSILARVLDPRLRDRVFAVRVRHDRRRAGRGQLVHVRRELVFAVEHVLEGDGLTRVRGHPAHAAYQTRLGAAADLVVRLVLADRFHQILPLDLI